MSISNQQFETTVYRVLSLLVHRYNAMTGKARDTEFSQHYYSVLYKIYHEALEFDDFSKDAVRQFDWGYKLGEDINRIIDSLQAQIIKFQEQEKLKEPYQYKTEYFKILWLFNSAFPKRMTTTDAQGTIISQKEFDYDFSLKTIQKLLKAKTAQEKADIFTTEIEKQKQTVIPSVPLTKQFVSTHSTDRKSIYKDLLRHHVTKLFWDYIKEQGFVPDEINAETMELQPPPIPKKLPVETFVEWTKPKTDFYKLVYALHASGCIKGEITKVMEALAPAFGIQLAKSWQSGVSKNMDYSNAGYNNTELFDDMKKAYLELVEKRENNKKP